MKEQILFMCVILNSINMLFCASIIIPQEAIQLPPSGFSPTAISLYLATPETPSTPPPSTPVDRFPLLDISLLNSSQIDLVSHMNSDSFSALDMDKPKASSTDAPPEPQPEIKRSVSHLTPDALLNLKMIAYRNQVPSVNYQKKDKASKPRDEMNDWIKNPRFQHEDLIAKTFGSDSPTYNRVYMKNTGFNKANEDGLISNMPSSISAGPSCRRQDQIAEYIIGKGKLGVNAHGLKRRETMEELKAEQQLIQSINNILEFIA